ncbi:MAG: NAD(P)-binding protein, partial [Steroidobacteraceae bacterium]|nr:NAD(P)-binding protein [Steroidobacteraceae bacterium]
MKRVVVIGGGFAGVAAACRLAGDGHRPLLLERTSRLGGRAASFVDHETGETIDYGHHVLMACCTATRGFLARVGASDAVRFQHELRIPLLCDREISLLRSSLLPGPLHLAPSLLGYQPIPMRDRLSVLRAGAALLLHRRIASESFGAWLERHGQSDVSVARLWNPISVATLNAPVERVSVAAARQVFREGFFTPGGANIGLFAWPLSEIFDRARAYLERREGEVRTQTAVARILVEGEA